MGGETLLYPEIDRFLRDFASAGIPVELVTNGSLIGEHIEALTTILQVEGSWLRVSINGWDGYGARVGWPSRGVELRNRVITGLKGLLQALPDHRKDRVFVSTVAFTDALTDLGTLAAALAGIGMKRMVVIRERDPRLKEFLAHQDPVRDAVVTRVKEVEDDGRLATLQISIADNILVDPIPQPKDYQPCPSIILKTLLGADGHLYACTDHRGCEYARLANIANYADDIGAAWRSRQRVDAALAYCPSALCRSIVCQRFEGNAAISMLKTPHETWTF